MAASQRRSGLTARDLLQHATEREPGEPSEPIHTGPVRASTPLEEILEALRADTAGAVELQRRALDEATERLQRVRETLDLAEELQRGSTGAAPPLHHALDDILRILGGPSRG